MALTLERVRAALDGDEPDYRRAARLGPDALPFVRELVERGDPVYAPRAAYLAGLLGGDVGAQLCKDASAHPDRHVRKAIAATAPNLAPERAREVLLGLVADRDEGVARLAVRSLPDELTPQLQHALQELQGRQLDPGIRDLVRRRLDT